MLKDQPGGLWFTLRELDLTVYAVRGQLECHCTVECRAPAGLMWPVTVKAVGGYGCDVGHKVDLRLLLGPDTRVLCDPDTPVVKS